MEVSVISMENIKPQFLSSDNHHPHEFKPFKLCLLDQLMATTHSPLIFFYPMKNSNDHRVGRRLKASLSETLNPFYPIAGRVKDNLIIHDFHRGVPFIEARVKGSHMSDFLASGGPKLEFLYNLLPFEPFCRTSQENAHHDAQLAVQLNTFDCGGIALGMNMGHKLMDGVTTSAFINTWAANCSGDLRMKKEPELCKASSVFHPRDPILIENCQKAMESMIYEDVRRGGKKGATRRFVFYNNAIAELRTRARSSKVMDPTRLEALSAFIWEAALKATTAAATADERQQLHCFMQSINLRPVMSPRLSKHSIGNLVTTALASCKDMMFSSNVSMKELVGVLRDAMGRVDENYINAMSSSEHKVMGACGSGELLTCSSWIGFGFNNFDFGWGKPVWTGLFGDPTGEHPWANNFIVFKELAARGRENSNAIEAWIRLDEDVMAALEHDPQFVKYASPNPPITIERTSSQIHHSTVI